MRFSVIGRAVRMGVCGLALAFCLPAAAQNSNFTDTRDGKKYRSVKIGDKQWMAENLNFKTGNSWCYENNDGNCQKYGRLYDWNTAVKACPAGWSLPSRKDWDNLLEAVGGLRDADGDYEIAGKKLKSKSGWKDNANGTDDYGFSALPGGYLYRGDTYINAGNWCYLWSSEEKGSGDAYRRRMRYNYDNVDEYYDGKDYGYSVRCVRN